MLLNTSRADHFVMRVPLPLIEYPFEMFMAAFAVLAGVPLLFGVGHTSTIQAVFPYWGEVLWALLMLTAGLGMTYGLVRHLYGTFVARGLELFGAVLLVWAGTVLYERGWVEGVPGGPLLTFMAGVCYLRSWWLQVRDRLLRQVEKASRP